MRKNNIPPISYGSYFDPSAYRDTVSLKRIMEQLRTGEHRPKNPFTTGETQVIPSDLLRLEIDSVNVDWERLAASPSDRMHISLAGKQAVYRQELMIMEILNNINEGN